jgi:hypothetical protein
MDGTIGRILLSDDQEHLENLLIPMGSTKVASESDAGQRATTRTRNVYHEKTKPTDGDKRICRVHFFHFKLTNQKLVVQHYKYSEPNNDIHLWTDFMHEIISSPYPDVPGRSRKSIADVLAFLVENARKPLAQQTHKPTGDPINRIRFKERSFLAFCFDHEGWDFPVDRMGDEDSTELPAVYFTEGGQWTKNHSFFDGRTAQLTIASSTVPLPVFYMVNHSKRNDNGDDLQDGEPQHIKFNIVVKIPLKGTTEKLTVIFDPGGTNLGPPTPPPQPG